MNPFALRSHTARFALILLLFVGPLAQAAELCQVATTNVADRMLMQPGKDGAKTALPCCDDTRAPSIHFTSMLVAATSARSFAKPLASTAVVPLLIRRAPCLTAHFANAALLPKARSAPSLPVYIALLRFLS